MLPCSCCSSCSYPLFSFGGKKKSRKVTQVTDFWKGPEGIYVALQCPRFQVQIMDAYGIPTSLLPKGKSAGKSIMSRIPSPSTVRKAGVEQWQNHDRASPSSSGWVLLPHLEPEPHNLCAVKTLRSLALWPHPWNTDRGKKVTKAEQATDKGVSPKLLPTISGNEKQPEC